MTENRNAQIKTERRRRNGDHLSGRRVRLFVDENQLDREKYEYRWINDTGNRVYDLTKQDDWELVTDRDGLVRPQDGTAQGAEVSTLGGIGPKGAERMVLVRKPKAYHDNDARKKSDAIDDVEASMRTGRVPGAGVEAGYTPSADGRTPSTRIGRGG